MPRGAAVAAIVAAAFADGVVHTSRAFGSLAQSVPAATRRVASRVDGPPALSIDAVASGGRPPDRGSKDEEAAAVAFEAFLSAFETVICSALVAWRIRISIGTVRLGGKAQSSACRYSRQKAWSGHGERIAIALRAHRREGERGSPPANDDEDERECKPADSAAAEPYRIGVCGGVVGGDGGGDGGGVAISGAALGDTNAAGDGCWPERTASYALTS